ncbi:MAG: tRNA lysidine(34) synthetase TilS [Thermoanaerobaculia bacterium]
MGPIAAALARAAESGLIPPGESVLLAVSGGADSTALLYGAAEAAARTGWAVAVGHVHHGWRPREADRDLAFVREHARRLGFPFAFRRHDAREASRALRLSPEAGARHVRYAALLEMAREAGAPLVATAHQRDDAVESYLLARDRRGGLARLAGPRERRSDGVVRPFLSVTRAEILEFLRERGLAFRRDSSNGNLALDRNRIRRALSVTADADRRAAGAELDRLTEARERLEREFSELVEPHLGFGPDSSSTDAEILGGCPEELRRIALHRLASPFARPGRPPMTGREREQIVGLLASGADFRFEAGRAIRFERRGPTLTVRCRPSPAGRREYDPASRTSTMRASAEIQL